MRCQSEHGCIKYRENAQTRGHQKREVPERPLQVGGGSPPPPVFCVLLTVYSTMRTHSPRLSGSADTLGMATASARRLIQKPSAGSRRGSTATNSSVGRCPLESSFPLGPSGRDDGCRWPRDIGKDDLGSVPSGRSTDAAFSGRPELKLR